MPFHRPAISSRGSPIPLSRARYRPARLCAAIHPRSRAARENAGMSETPLPANVRSDSKRRNGRSTGSTVGANHVLEFDDAAVHKSNGLVWVLHSGRDVRVEKGIVKRIAEDGEAMSMMAAKYSDAAAPVTGIAPWPVAVWAVTIPAVA